MRIAMLSTGRFWLVDLARELSARGHEVRVYSLVPPWRTRNFGLPPACNRWLGPYLAPLYAATKLPLPKAARGHANHALTIAVDRVAASLLEPCDVLVAMAGIGVHCLEVAKRRHGAKVFLERASRHILSQRAILEAIPGVSQPVADWSVTRELAGYRLADVITVPAHHVADSFREQGFLEPSLFINPFGASLEVFRPTPAPDGPPTIVVTGGWSLRKGCDVLVEAWRQLPGVRLLHVGPVLDAPLPADPLFEHVDPVPQAELARFYAQAHVFALASREEGLALVQVQALASGLPLVCTTRTGGADLAAWARPGSIIAVPPDRPDALAHALRQALEQAKQTRGSRDLLGSNRDQLSWSAYAERYEARMRAALA